MGNVILAVLGTVAIAAALLVVRADVANDTRPLRRWVEALIPLVGLLALVLVMWGAR